VKNYGKIVAPLTTLLKNNSSVWNEVTMQAFSVLKETKCTTLGLVVPNFTKAYVLECDALGRGQGVLLLQDGRSLAVDVYVALGGIPASAY